VKNPLSSFLDARARQSAVVFAGMALRDEVTGKPIRMAAHHREWQRIWSNERRSVIWSPSEYGKSQQLAAHVAWRIGRDPGTRVGILSATAQQAQRLQRAVAIIVAGPVFQRVFGAAIDRSTADELTLATRPATMKDANVTAAAFDLSSLLGARFDFAACDDVVAREAIRTQPARDAAYQGFLSVTASRLSPAGVIAVVGTAEHTDDIPHRLSRLPDYVSARYPALDDQGRPTWPERWPAERIEQRRLELGPIGFQRAMMCVAIDEATLVFQPDDITQALAKGRDPERYSYAGARCIIGVDPAWTVTSTSDESGIAVVAVDDFGNRHLVDVRGVKLDHDALTSYVVNMTRARRGVVYCESNGAGGVIASNIGKQVPCKALPTTATTKRARVEALAAELSASRWVFAQPMGGPSRDLRQLCDDLQTYSPESHCGDRLSALLIACEGARAYEQRPRGRFTPR
jgi:hypothetical protein